jgi:hypothetical protein
MRGGRLGLSRLRRRRRSVATRRVTAARQVAEPSRSAAVWASATALAWVTEWAIE